MHADGPDLPGPDPGPPVLWMAPGQDVPVGAGADHGLLERGDELPDVGLRGEVHDRIGHDLAGPVVGDVPSPVGLVDLEATAREPLRRGNHVPAVGAPAQGQDGRVLEEEEPVGVRVAGPDPVRGEPHQLEAVGVLDPPEPVDTQNPHGWPIPRPAPLRLPWPGAYLPDG